MNGTALYEAVLAGTMSLETVERCEKQLAAHIRAAFHRALGKLEELQARRRELKPAN